MKKRVAIGFTVFFLSIVLYGCSSSTGEDTVKDLEVYQKSVQEESLQTLDLTGEWEQVNSNSENAYHIAAIKNDTIEIYSITEGDEAKTLYWAGTFVAPTAVFETYLWSSANDKEKSATAFTASKDDRKDFTYENGQISYKALVMGVTQNVQLEKVD